LLCAMLLSAVRQNKASKNTIRVRCFFMGEFAESYYLTATVKSISSGGRHF
jgi:hypothetical protein